MTFTGLVGKVCMWPLRAIINASVRLGIHPNTLTLIGVLVNVAVGLLVGVFVAVVIGAVTVSTVLALVEDAFVANALTILVKVVDVVGFADAVTVMVVVALIARSESRTSKLDAVKLAVPPVVVTSLIVSHVGKSLSVMTVPRAR